MSPLPDEYYYDSVKIIGFSEKYFPIKEAPLTSVIRHYYDFSEPIYAKDRMFQAFWVIRDEELLFEYAQPMVSNIRYNFNNICQKEDIGDKYLVVANWFSGKINVQIAYDWGFINENGRFPDISTSRVYTIVKGIITKMVEECEFFDPMPF